MKKRSTKKPNKRVKARKPKAGGSAHSWRLCPLGEHWVVTHPLRVPPSKTNPEGGMTTRHAHCAANPSGKDQLYIDEVHEIDRRHFFRLKNGPTPNALKFPNGNQYDPLIAGWVKYWNEVLHPEVPLTPNVVKALIASESGFDPGRLADPKNSNSARGLMQLLNATRKALGDEEGELQDHFLTFTKEDLNDPSANICAGVRWLFQKQKLASAKLGREATWEEAVSEYKSTLTPKPGREKRAKELMDRYRGYFRRLES